MRQIKTIPRYGKISLKQKKIIENKRLMRYNKRKFIRMVYIMILCCKTCGNCFETDTQHQKCTYCGGKTDVLFSDEEVQSIDEEELDTLIIVSREKYKVNNNYYDIGMWAKREYEEKQKKASKKENLKRQMMSNHMLTTGYNFENYSIVAYKGVISGESVLGTGFLSEFSVSVSDLFGTESNTFSQKLNQAKETALGRMIEKSVAAGGNAIIGIDFDYITFSNNIIGVVANGTSVSIEKKEEKTSFESQ